MSTNSTIAFEDDDGKVYQIYCHWDGYPSNNGRILHEHYTHIEKIRELIALGDLSQLEPTIGVEHDFNDKCNGQCTAYGRDRGESDTEALEFNGLFEYKNCTDSKEEYNYIWLNEPAEWHLLLDNKLKPVVECGIYVGFTPMNKRSIKIPHLY